MVRRAIGDSVVDTGHSAKFTYKVEKSGAIRIDDQSIKFTHGPSGEKSKRRHGSDGHGVTCTTTSLIQIPMVLTSMKVNRMPFCSDSLK